DRVLDQQAKNGEPGLLRERREHDDGLRAGRSICFVDGGGNFHYSKYMELCKRCQAHEKTSSGARRKLAPFFAMAWTSG
ncbi:MAG: hypothetical protein ABI881_13590, partial [Betaproteobacteria bacterium]